MRSVRAAKVTQQLLANLQIVGAAVRGSAWHSVDVVSGESGVEPTYGQKSARWVYNLLPVKVSASVALSPILKTLDWYRFGLLVD